MTQPSVCETYRLITPPSVWEAFLLPLTGRLGDYIVNLHVFCFYKIIGKLTVFCNFRSSVCRIYQYPVHYRRTAFSSQVKSKIGNILPKSTGLRISLNIGGSPLESRSHTHPSHSETSRLLTSSSIYLSIYLLIINNTTSDSVRLYDLYLDLDFSRFLDFFRWYQSVRNTITLWLSLYLL